MSEYEEKQERRLQRYQELAIKAEEGSQAAYERSNSAVAGIPMGQPILNGFRWSPYNGCWQRQISDWSIHLAKEIATEVAS